MSVFSVRPIMPEDAPTVTSYLAARWGSPVAVAHGVLFHAAELPGFVALAGDEWIGLLTYHIDDDGCEIVTLNSDHSGLGVGTALIDTAKQTSLAAGCSRLWLITTNDNWPAFRFYQRRGFHIAAVRPNAIERSRELKPEIPLTGVNGIPIRDEIEFEMALARGESEGFIST